jgi:hypothetical protein
MAVGRIERIVRGVVVARAARHKGGHYACHQFGSNVAPVPIATLDDVADFLKTHPRSGVRMDPGWVRITRNIWLDGVRLR